MAIIQSQISVNESAHAHVAIKLAKQEKMFLNSVGDNEWTIKRITLQCSNATDDDYLKLKEW